MLIQFKDVSKLYDGQLVFEHLNLNVTENKILCILGPSGCGKSTVLNIMADLEGYNSGKIVRPDLLRKSFVFQEDRLLPWKTVYENINFVKDESLQEKDIDLILEDVELTAYKDFYPHQLSGGMQQRVSIARAFFYHSDLMLMDEPFSSLDSHLKLDILQKLIEVWEKNKCSIVFITHDIDEALLLADELIIFSKRPATILKKIAINLPQRNRKLIEPELIELRTQVLEATLGMTK